MRTGLYDGQQVEIIRKGKKTTRVKWSNGFEDKVQTDLITFSDEPPSEPATDVVTEESSFASLTGDPVDMSIPVPPLLSVESPLGVIQAMPPVGAVPEPVVEPPVMFQGPLAPVVDVEITVPGPVLQPVPDAPLDAPLDAPSEPTSVLPPTPAVPLVTVESDPEAEPGSLADFGFVAPLTAEEPKAEPQIAGNQAALERISIPADPEPQAPPQNPPARRRILGAALLSREMEKKRHPSPTGTFPSHPKKLGNG